MRLEIHLKTLTILGIVIGLLLLGVFLFIYNSKKEIAKAQVAGEILWKCEEITYIYKGRVETTKEIIIGEVIEKASQVANNITNAFNKITQASSQQIILANEIYQSPLPGECQPEKCQTNCDRRCEDKDGDGVCSEEEWQCQIRPCTGDACPVDKLMEDINSANQIASLHKDIEASVDSIKNEADKRDDIIDKLNRAREQLAVCVTSPTDAKTAEEWAQKQKHLLPCDLAKRLSPDVKECHNENNFFCCTPIFY